MNIRKRSFLKFDFSLFAWYTHYAKAGEYGNRTEQASLAISVPQKAINKFS